MYFCRFKIQFNRLLYIYKTFFFSPPAMLAAKRQDGGLFKSPPYPGYPFIMIPDLTSPYLPNGSLSPTARTVSSFISPHCNVQTQTGVFETNTHTPTRTHTHAHTLSPHTRTGVSPEVRQKRAKPSFATRGAYSSVAFTSVRSFQPRVFAVDSS